MVPDSAEGDLPFNPKASPSKPLSERNHLSAVADIIVTERELAEDDEAQQDFLEAVEDVNERARVLTRSVNAATTQIAEVRERMRQAEADGIPVDSEALILQEEAALSLLDSVRDEQYALVAACLSWRWTATDVAAWCHRAEEMGAAHPRFRCDDLVELLQLERVPCAPFRERLERLVADGAEEYQHGEGGDDHEQYIDNTIMEEVIEVLGCQDERGVGRKLGRYLRPPSGPVKPTLSLFIDYDEAVKLARVLGFHPYQVGI